jgi:hypothetical protein
MNEQHSAEKDAPCHAGLVRGTFHPGPASECPSLFCRVTAPDVTSPGDSDV